MLMLRNRTNTPALWNGSNDTTPTLLSNWIDEVFDRALDRPLLNGTGFMPELNGYETDTDFEVTVALPGMSKNDFEISYDVGSLTISGERKMEHEDKGHRYHRVESRFGRFSRTLPLPADLIDEEKINARYDNGVLYITIPKVKEKAAKRIKVS